MKLYIFVVKGVQYFAEEASKVFFWSRQHSFILFIFFFFFRSVIVVSDRWAEFLNALFPGVDPGGGRGGWPSLGEPIRTQSR